MAKCVGNVHVDVGQAQAGQSPTIHIELIIESQCMKEPLPRYSIDYQWKIGLRGKWSVLTNFGTNKINEKLPKILKNLPNNSGGKELYVKVTAKCMFCGWKDEDQDHTTILMASKEDK